jgi:hypothetical protein
VPKKAAGKTNFNAEHAKDAEKRREEILCESPRFSAPLRLMFCAFCASLRQKLFVFSEFSLSTEAFGVGGCD